MGGSMIAVAMSGGLDSSVAAMLLARGGEPVMGLSMLLWDRGGERVHGRCCGALDLGDARRVAAQVGIPHYTLRLEEAFRRAVVDPFVEGYLAGETPVPCTACNTWIKFGLLLDQSRRLGASRLATGHYARIERRGDVCELHAARHPEKDQSYYLFELTQEQLAASLFPLGELAKDEVRRLAREAELVVAAKGESMELCFVAGGVAEFVSGRAAERPEAFRSLPGEGATMVDTAGRELGRGAPYYRYTVGQRRDLGVATGRRLYVLEISPERNRVVVGAADELLAAGLGAERAHWIGEPPDGELEATVRIRARHDGVACRVHPGAAGRLEIEFAEPQRGVAPGQAAVLYDGTRVLGGAWISGRL
jgi:tRNA-specific 2-thiouridylase